LFGEPFLQTCSGLISFTLMKEEEN
jgi:hypothetical protein